MSNILEDDKSRYADYTGCGNTLNANHAIVRRLIQDSLRYWVSETRGRVPSTSRPY
jgi:glycogen operon protein